MAYTIILPPADKYQTILEDSEGLSSVPIESMSQKRVYMMRKGNMHKVCMEIAVEEVIELIKKYQNEGITIKDFDISAIGATHFICWERNQQLIKQETDKINGGK